MTKIAVDIVDSFVFRRHHGIMQFLLLQRHPELPLGGTWHCHANDGTVVHRP